MVIGILLILAGIMIALYPELLSMIVASFLILIGATLTIVSYRFKKMRRHFSDPFADFFIRF